MKRPRTTTAAATSKDSTANTIPTSLDFNQYSFVESARKKGKNLKNVVLDFIDHVEESISSRSGDQTCIDRFNLVVKFSRLNREEGDANIERWLNYAVFNNVKELFLSYHMTNPSLRNGRRYLLPDSLYRSTSLETLDLFGCQFKKPRSEFGIALSLKKLRLSRVTIDRETLQNVVSSCGFLEELCIESCEGFEAVRVVGNKLEVVDVYLDRDKVQIVAVSAPNLRCLSFGGGFDGVRGSFEALEEFDNLKELRFHDVVLFDEDDEFLQVIPEFPRLEKFQLERCGRGLDFLELDQNEILRFRK